VYNYVRRRYCKVKTEMVKGKLRDDFLDASTAKDVNCIYIKLVILLDIDNDAISLQCPRTNISPTCDNLPRVERYTIHTVQKVSLWLLINQPSKVISPLVS